MLHKLMILNRHKKYLHIILAKKYRFQFNFQKINSQNYTLRECSQTRYQGGIEELHISQGRRQSNGLVVQNPRSTLNIL